MNARRNHDPILSLHFFIFLALTLCVSNRAAVAAVAGPDRVVVAAEAEPCSNDSYVEVENGQRGIGDTHLTPRVVMRQGCLAAWPRKQDCAARGIYILFRRI